MGQEHTATEIGLDLLILLAVTFTVLFVFKTAMQKSFNLRKRKLFQSPIINDTHKKWDKISRNTGIILTILFYIYFVVTMGPIEWFWLLLILVFFLPTLTQAYMEWRYAGGWKEALYTIAEMVVFFAVLIAVTSLLL